MRLIFGLILMLTLTGKNIIPVTVYGEYAALGFNEGYFIQLNSDNIFEASYSAHACLSLAYSEHKIRGSFQIEEGILKLKTEVLINEILDDIYFDLSIHEMDSLEKEGIDPFSMYDEIIDTIYNPKELPFPFQDEYIIALGKQEVWLFENNKEPNSAIQDFITRLNTSNEEQLTEDDYNIGFLGFDYLCKSQVENQMSSNHRENRKDIRFVSKTWNERLIH